MPRRNKPFKTKRKTSLIFSTTTSPQTKEGPLTVAFRNEMTQKGYELGPVKLIMRDKNTIEIVDEESRDNFLVQRSASGFDVLELKRHSSSSELRKTTKMQKQFLKAFRQYMAPWKLNRKQLSEWEKRALSWYNTQTHGAIAQFVEKYSHEAMTAALPPIYQQALAQMPSTGSKQIGLQGPAGLLPFSPGGF